MKLSKIQTLNLYLDKEKTNLENLKLNNNNRNEIVRAEQTIRKLQEQLHLLCGEVRIFVLLCSPFLIVKTLPNIILKMQI